MSSRTVGLRGCTAITRKGNLCTFQVVTSNGKFCSVHLSRDVSASDKYICQATTRSRNRCTNVARINNLCGIHTKTNANRNAQKRPYVVSEVSDADYGQPLSGTDSTDSVSDADVDSTDSDADVSTPATVSCQTNVSSFMPGMTCIIPGCVSCKLDSDPVPDVMPTKGRSVSTKTKESTVTETTVNQQGNETTLTHLSPFSVIGKDFADPQTLEEFFEPVTQTTVYSAFKLLHPTAPRIRQFSFRMKSLGYSVTSSGKIDSEFEYVPEPLTVYLSLTGNLTQILPITSASITVLYGSRVNVPRSSKSYFPAIVKLELSQRFNLGFTYGEVQFIQRRSPEYHDSTENSLKNFFDPPDLGFRHRVYRWEEISSYRQLIHHFLSGLHVPYYIHQNGVAKFMYPVRRSRRHYSTVVLVDSSTVPN